MPARLVPLIPGTATVVTLQRPVVLIGRHPDCDVRINLPQISRRHCCVALAYERLLIRDLGSRNGVRVNGRLVDEAALQAGDEVAIGQLIFRLEETKPAPAAPPRTGAKPAKPLDPPELPVSSNDSAQDLVPLDDLFPGV